MSENFQEFESANVELFPLINNLQKKRPKKNFIYTAIETLKESEEIEQFGNELVEYFRINDPEAIDDPNKAAGTYIGFTLGYFDKKVQVRWKNVLSQIIIGPAATGIVAEKNIADLTSAVQYSLHQK